MQGRPSAAPNKQTLRWAATARGDRRDCGPPACANRAAGQLPWFVRSKPPNKAR